MCDKTSYVSYVWLKLNKTCWDFGWVSAFYSSMFQEVRDDLWRWFKRSLIDHCRLMGWNIWKIWINVEQNHFGYCQAKSLELTWSCSFVNLLHLSCLKSQKVHFQPISTTVGCLESMKNAIFGIWVWRSDVRSPEPHHVCFWAPILRKFCSIVQITTASMAVFFRGSWRSCDCQKKETRCLHRKVR